MPHAPSLPDAAELPDYGGAAAFEERKNEKEQLKTCEVSLCNLVTRKAPSEGDLSCPLSRTWAKDHIKEGSASGKVSWSFGDARCSVDLKVSRATVIDALKAPDAMFHLPEHVVAGEVEREHDVTPVKLKLAPKLHFKDGRVVGAWINLREVEGPSTMKGLAFTVAKLEDKVGIFHKALLKAINHQLLEKCPKVSAGG